MKELLLAFLIAFLGGVEWAAEKVFPETDTWTPHVVLESAAPTTTPVIATERHVQPVKNAPANKPAVTASAAITLEKQTNIQEEKKQTPQKQKMESEQQVATDLSTQIEGEIMAFMNAERAAAGLAALVPDLVLVRTARSHSTDMITNDYFSHEDRSGCSSSCRATNAGYSWQIVGENIYMMSGYELDAREAAKMIVEGWMSSPGHRANILRENYTHAGVGVTVRDRDMYATSVYARPR